MNDSLGYIFDRVAPNHYALNVNIYAIPTEKYYDPERVSFPIVTADGRIERLNVVYPWRQQEQYRVSPGWVILHDRKDKIVQCGTYGGDLTIQNRETSTHCSVISPAPLVQLCEISRSIESEVFIMFEAMLARQRAELGVDQSIFERQLGTVDPLLLYGASLTGIERALAQIQISMNGRYQKILASIHNEQQTFQQSGYCPTSVPALADLISSQK